MSLRSAPAQNVGPLPVMTTAWISSSGSNSSSAASTPVAMSPFTALRASGRLSRMIPTRSRRSTSTAAMADSSAPRTGRRKVSESRRARGRGGRCRRPRTRRAGAVAAACGMGARGLGSGSIGTAGRSSASAKRGFRSRITPRQTSMRRAAPIVVWRSPRRGRRCPGALRRAGTARRGRPRQAHHPAADRGRCPDLRDRHEARQCAQVDQSTKNERDGRVARAWASACRRRARAEGTSRTTSRTRRLPNRAVTLPSVSAMVTAPMPWAVTAPRSRRCPRRGRSAPSPARAR